MFRISPVILALATYGISKCLVHEANSFSLGVLPGGRASFSTSLAMSSVPLGEDRLNTFVYYYANDKFEIQHQSVEDNLHADGIIPLNAENEVAEVKHRQVCLSGVKSLIPKQLSMTPTSEIPIFLIGGRSAQRKRLFTLKQVAKYGLEDYAKQATLYVKPYDVDVFDEGTEDVEALMKWIKQEISEKYGSFDKLHMHVSLVLEGGRKSNGFLDEKESLTRIAELLNEFADSTRLVVCGSGVFGMKHTSSADMMVIHCKEGK
jgi:hypothetical protein